MRDPLTPVLKGLKPDEPEEEIDKDLAELRATNPGITDDQIVASAKKMMGQGSAPAMSATPSMAPTTPAAPALKSSMNPEIVSYLTSKQAQSHPVETPKPTGRASDALLALGGGIADAFSARGGVRGSAMQNVQGIIKDRRAEEEAAPEKARKAKELEMENDPNSVDSQFFQQTVSKMLNVPMEQLKGMSAATLRRTFPQVTKIYEVEKDNVYRTLKAEEDARQRDLDRQFKEKMLASTEQGRKDELAARRDEREIAKEEKKAQSNEKYTKDFRENLSRTAGPYADWLTIKTALDSAETATKNPSPYGDINMIYSAVKAFDPNSAVREGEISLFSGSTSVKNKLQGALSRAFSGKTLLPEQRKDVLSLIKNMEKTKRDIAKKHVQPTIDQATRLGLNLNEIDPTLPYLTNEKEVTYAKNPQTGERIMSTDGGKTWQPAN